MAARRRPTRRSTSARRRPSTATRPGAYPSRRSGGRSRQHRTFGEQISTGAATEVRLATRLAARAAVIAALVATVLLLSGLARLTGHMPDPPAAVPVTRSLP